MSFEQQQASLQALDINATIRDMEQQFPRQPLTVLDVLGIDYSDLPKPQFEQGLTASAVTDCGGELEDNM